MCSVTVALENRTGISVKPNGAVLKVVSADLWHRSMDHANRNSMDVLRTMTHSAVEYIGNLTPCDFCRFGTSEQQHHPQQASYDVQRPLEHVTVRCGREGTFF